MIGYEIIAKKRDRHELTREEIDALVRNYSSGKIPDYQMSAFLMATYLNGMSFQEITDLTLAMRDSGIVLDLSDIPGVKIDKHSTGGVGDKISLILAPLAASMGVTVPMISGRGLGHTGGTLDKLQSIPGFDIFISTDRFRSILKSIGVSMIGQTEEIAPADRKLYALRDVTGTIESIPLISASIMSKKLAEGIDALVLDVKVGNGAFMKTLDRAVDLAQHLVMIGEGAGKQTIALLTSMDEPLGQAIGNWLEVAESIEVLKGKGPTDIRELSVILAAYMKSMADQKISYDVAYNIAAENLDNGKAFSKFIELVKHHGGDFTLIQNPQRYPKAALIKEVTAQNEGFVVSMNTYEIGMTGILIGAGRQTKEDSIDHTAGIILHKKVGDSIKKGDCLATIYTERETRLDEASRKLLNAYRIDFNAPDKQPLILGVLDKNGFRSI
ncbi:thymidine phosphorylase [bacterium]|nr:thymidine phosphorylase [bacterium]